MGLEQNDEIVRRRVVQKLEFVNEDLDTGVEPGPIQLAAYFQQHRARYDTEPTVSFEQIFFSADQGGDAAAKSRAQGALHLSGRAATGDTFADGLEFSSLSRTGANALFGDSELSAALFATPARLDPLSVGTNREWAGPFKSAYGWHLVRITARHPPQAVELESVRARVRSDYLADVREQANAVAFRKIASKYRIVRIEPREGMESPRAVALPAVGAGPRA
jgi:hypothetical protein